ncbi:ROK family transcriptional regulator [Pseudonocardia sp.]|uniref:ROK family transcriptional regulator n=1 Tax=Pseudonocardia sp. TaxID=60912 RepID=UPI00261BFC24|nr:ROK family transcriptional regulator [Pseudonocardia sp.]
MVGVAGEQWDSLVAVLDLIRRDEARTRAELGRQLALGRSLVTQRVGQLIGSGLVEEGSLGSSTGGRAPRELRFRASAGTVLVAELGVTKVSVGRTDLSGALIEHHEQAWDIAQGPDASLRQIGDLFDTFGHREPVWGIGLGVPGPVEFLSGRPIAPPMMPGWDGFPVRDWLAARYAAPVWVDNEVNAMALGEYRAGLGRGIDDQVFVKIGSGIGAGLISGGRLHRGAQGCAGDVGHVAVTDPVGTICRCGRSGCLEAVAGGYALVRDATAAAAEGHSEHLAARLMAMGRLEPRDVTGAAEFGDRVAMELMNRAGRRIGEMLATLVNFYNPSLIVVGGGVAAVGDQLLAAIRQNVYQRSLPLATRDLRIVASELDDRAGLVGAGLMVIDELFSSERIRYWFDCRTPAGRPELAAC